jgi:hypothetical protein
MARVLAALIGGALLLLAVTDAFDTVVPARRARRFFRVTRWFYQATCRCSYSWAEEWNPAQREKPF